VNSGRPITVLSADDHPLMRDGISFALQSESDIRIIAEANDGLAAVAAYRAHRPDVVLMDLHMPKLNGIDALIAIRNEVPDAKCIVLTTYEGDAQASRALKAGAMGYIWKTMLRTTLVQAIRAVHRGRRCIPSEISAEITQHLGFEELTSREIEVLRSVAAGCTNKVIGDRLRISENTVKGHLKNIVTKLQANDRAHAVTVAMKRGFFDV
jgi:DNA-binding NarL/FixJ family response regulator